jgi:hypothetical protein
MSKRRLLQLWVSLLIGVAIGHGQQLTVEAGPGKQTVLAKAEIEALPHIKVTTHDADKPVTYEGVALKDVLEKGGVELGPSVRGKRLASCVLVEAADGYRVVIALPEVDPDFTEKQIVLAFMQDGKPLDANAGPYRIVIPDEKRMARWVRQVTKLRIVDVQ